jgi:acyl carrier protein
MEVHMDNPQFKEDLAAILEVEPEEVTADLELHSGNWNSLSIVSTIVLIDEYFGTTIDGEKLRQCQSVGSLWELIQLATNAP